MFTLSLFLVYKEQEAPRATRVAQCAGRLYNTLRRMGPRDVYMEVVPRMQRAESALHDAHNAVRGTISQHLTADGPSRLFTLTWLLVFKERRAPHTTRVTPGAGRLYITLRRLGQRECYLEYAASIQGAQSASRNVRDAMLGTILY